MKILVSDYREQMEADYRLTIEAIQKVLPEEKRKELQVIVEPYDTLLFWETMKEAEGMITAFLPIDEEFLSRAPKLQYISINAAGYSNVDLAAVKAHGIKVAHIREYCTREVSEHAISLLMALNNNLKLYEKHIAAGGWNYGSAPMRPTLDNMTVAIYGLGKIGRSTASILKAMGCRVGFVDPFVSVAEGASQGVIKMTTEEVQQEADVIINHMALTESNYHLFDYAYFAACKKQVIFINVGRGGCVEEMGLMQALEEEKLYGAGLDVLEDENPNLSGSPMLSKSNLILTPHAAFYSKNSMERLHKISGANLGYMLAEEENRVDSFVER